LQQLSKEKANQETQNLFLDMWLVRHFGCSHHLVILHTNSSAWVIYLWSPKRVSGRQLT